MKHVLALLASACAGTTVAADTMDATPSPVEAAGGLARRVLSDRADGFLFETIPADGGRDVFEIENRDMDELLATRREFLLGSWLADARRWATTDEGRRLYEWNARNLITLRGGCDSGLHEYAHRQRSGLLAGFYLRRWEMFFRRLEQSLAEGKPLDANSSSRTSASGRRNGPTRASPTRQNPRAIRWPPAAACGRSTPPAAAGRQNSDRCRQCYWTPVIPSEAAVILSGAKNLAVR